MDWQATLLERERGFWAAAGDPEFYRDNLAQEALMVFPAPYGIMEREPTLEAVRTAQPWTRYDFSETTYARFGTSAAVICYRVSAARATGADYDAYISSVYVQESGAWRLALHQQTPISEQE